MQPPRGATLIHCQSLGSLISGISAGPGQVVTPDISGAEFGVQPDGLH